MWRSIDRTGILISTLWLAGIIPESALAQDILFRSPLPPPSDYFDHYNPTSPMISAPPPVVREKEEYKTPLQTEIGIGWGAVTDKVVYDPAKEFVKEIVTNSPKLVGIAKTIPLAGQIGEWMFSISTKAMTDGLDPLLLVPGPVGWLLTPSSIAPEEAAFGNGSPNRGIGGLDRGPGGPIDFGGSREQGRDILEMGPISIHEIGSQEGGDSGEASKDTGSKDDTGSKEEDKEVIKNDTGNPG